MDVCVIWTDLLCRTAHLFSRISPCCLPLWQLQHPITHLEAELTQFPSQIAFLREDLAQEEAAVLIHPCAEHGRVHYTLPQDH